MPVIDHWWQTETGWAIAANCLGHRAAAGQARLADASRCRAGTCACSTATGTRSPPARPARSSSSCRCRPARSPTLWNADERFREAYLAPFPGYYQTADAGYIDEDGYVFVMARTDDIINVAGHRLSTGAMEEVLAAHPDVAECAVIGVADELKGQVPVGFARAEGRRRRARTARSSREVVQLVRERIGPVAAFKTAIVVERLPKTRSGKILRGTMRRIADGEEYTDARHDRRPGDPRRDQRGAARRRLRGHGSVQPIDARAT